MGDTADPPRATGPGLVVACIAPHGGRAIPEACPPEERELAPATQGGMLELAWMTVAPAPDALVVLTPHGIHLDGNFAVVTAGRVAGALEDVPAVALDVPVARELALGILETLREGGIPAVGVSFGGNVPADAVMPLDWGTLIPLWYLGGRRHPPVPVVVIAPARDRPLPEHVDAGAAIADASRRSGLRVGLVASADHAHTHRADGPYGYHPRAGELDEQIVTAVREGRLSSLLDLDPDLVEAARPDSWWQLLMLAGATGDAWRVELISFETPTYFSMLCAAYEPP
jgi:aromatic ring-opening dioxygenase LigB subunit